MTEYGGVWGKWYYVEFRTRLEDIEIPSGFLGTLILHPQAILQLTLSPLGCSKAKLTIGWPCGYIERSSQPTASQVIPAEVLDGMWESWKSAFKISCCKEHDWQLQLFCSKILQYVWATVLPTGCSQPRLSVEVWWGRPVAGRWKSSEMWVAQGLPVSIAKTFLELAWDLSSFLSFFPSLCLWSDWHHFLMAFPALLAGHMWVLIRK